MISENVHRILSELPPGVKLEAAAKERSVAEIEEALGAGIEIIGENYVQEAAGKFKTIGKKAAWHLIGHLQKNKVKAAVEIFDTIETLDSLALATVLDRECKKRNKVMPVLIEVNSAAEPQKSGLRLEEVEGFLEEVSAFTALSPRGLMTLGPWRENPEELRPYFRKVKYLFDKVGRTLGQKGEWKVLSMGMSVSFRVAIEEGANLVRVGTAIFGERKSKY